MAFRFTTAGESHGPGPRRDRRGAARRARARPRGARPRHGAAPARPRPRRADEDRAGRRRDPLRRAPRAHARQPDRRARRQPRLRELGGADEPVAGRRRGRGGPPAAARPRRPRRARRSTATTTCATCSSAPAPARPRRASRPAALAREFLAALGVSIHSHVLQIADVEAPTVATTSGPSDFDAVDESPVRCLDPEAEARMVAEIDRLRKANETLGGNFEVRRLRARPGARLARLVGRAPRRPPRPGDGLDPGDQGRRRSARPGTSPRRPGSEAHDEIFYDDERGWYRETNRAGGVEGGMSNGEPLVVQAAMKPLSTLTQPLRSVDVHTKQPGRRAQGAHRLDHRPRGGGGRGGDGRAGARGLLPREVRRRPHRRRARRGRRLRGADRVADVARQRALVFIGFMGAGKSDGGAGRRARRSASHVARRRRR